MLSEMATVGGQGGESVTAEGLEGFWNAIS